VPIALVPPALGGLSGRTTQGITTVHKFKIPTDEERAERKDRQAKTFADIEFDVHKIKQLAFIVREELCDATESLSKTERLEAVDRSLVLLELLYEAAEGLHIKYHLRA
jgi:hypothetical protein